MQGPIRLVFEVAIFESSTEKISLRLLIWHAWISIKAFRERISSSRSAIRSVSGIVGRPLLFRSCGDINLFLVIGGRDWNLLCSMIYGVIMSASKFAWLLQTTCQLKVLGCEGRITMMSRLVPKNEFPWNIKAYPNILTLENLCMPLSWNWALIYRHLN